MASSARRILIVEDEGIVAADIKRSLEDSGFEVTGVAASAADALQEASATLPDLVLMDIRIQGEPDGIEVAALPGRQFDVPTVYLTAHGDKDTIERAKRTHPLGFLLKPFKQAELVNTIAFALEKTGEERRERARQQTALRESEGQKRFLADVLERVDQPFGVGHLDGTLGFVNSAFERLTGYSREELRRIYWASTLTPPEWREAERAELEELKRTGLPVRYEKEYLRKDGTRVPIELLVHLANDERGRPLYYYAFVTDLTERKRAEEALRRAKEEWERTFDAVPDLIAVLDREHRVLRVNRAMAARLGATPDQCVGLRCYEAVHALGAPPGFCPHSLTCADGKTHTVEVHEDRLGGDFLVTTTPLTDPQGRLIGSVHVAHDVTQRKRAEEELRQSEQRLRLFIEHTPAPVAMFDRDMRYLAASRRFLSDYRLSLPDVIGRSHYDVFPELPEHWKQVHQRCLSGAVEKCDEDQFLRGDGTLDWVRWEILPWRTAAGEVGGIILFSEVITERKRAEQALREIEEQRKVAEAVQAERQRFYDILEKMPVMVCLLTPDYQVRFANRRFREFFGESEGRRCFEYAFNRTEPCSECQSFTPLETHAPHHWEWATAKGAYMDIYDFPFTDPDGSPLVLEVDIDITERKRAEAELARHRDHLAELVAERTAQLEAAHADALSERNRLQAVMSALPVGVSLVDAQGGNLQSNAAFEEIWGSPRPVVRSVSDYAAYKATWADTGRPVEPEEWASARAVQKGETVIGQELEIGRSDGARAFVLNSAAPVRDATGQIVGSAVALMDITARKRLEAERERQARLKDEFLAMLGHELRNPLAAISTAVHLLANGVTAERRASLDRMIGRQVAVLQRLVDDLLDVARITHGQIELKKERIDLAEFLQRVTSGSRSPVAGRGQELVVRLPSERVLFMADGVRLEQIAVNLLNNASKYTDPGGSIELSGAREGSEVVLRCKDNGRGIPLEMQKIIFDPFIRVRMAGDDAEGGVGIGLALVKRLVELHDGTVTVRSAGPGTGSEFVVRLPLVEPPAAPVASKARPARGGRRAFSVAIVEDNPDVAETLAIALEQAGHKATVFADGPSALEDLAGLRPTAILLDIGLPGMDGYEVAARLRKEQHLRHTLLVGLSGFKRRVEAGKARGEFDHYFVKPVHPDQLLALLETRLGVNKAGDASTLRVLLVEDSVDTAEATADLLRREGLEVRIALSGGEALAQAGEFRPQLVLCDLQLPDMPGPALVRALRSKAATRRVRAAMLTAPDQPDVDTLRDRAKQLRVDEFVSKPLTSAKLRTLVEKLKRRR